MREFTWKITGLSSSFTTGNGYTSAGITSSKFTVGNTPSISQIIDSIDAKFYGTSNTAGPKTKAFEPGYYTFWAWTRISLGTYWPAGSASVLVEEDNAAKRPGNWEWWSVIESGAPVRISANEWNSFCAKIDEFREYVGYQPFGFGRVWRGDPITADLMNDARMAIASMGPTASVPPWRNPGDTISASYFMRLKDYLNSIP